MVVNRTFEKEQLEHDVMRKYGLFRKHDFSEIKGVPHSTMRFSDEVDFPKIISVACHKNGLVRP